MTPALRAAMALGGLCAASACAAAQPADDDVLPITRITLYRSGVGYFERDGEVSGTRTMQLRFAAGQINDILKSLVLLDHGGGDIDAVTYGSKEPLARRLAAFGVDISGAPTAAELFMQLRGSDLEVTTDEGPVAGTILGVETRTTVVPGPSEHATISEPYVNLVTGQGVRSVAISRIRTFELQEQRLDRELKRALAALAEHRADRYKTMDLTFRGPDDRPRPVVVAYVHEMPAWKASYRLVLPESGSGEAMIQGWAIVENTTDEDWRGVRLSLASGRPVGFTMALYEPIFVARPTVPVPIGGAIRGRTYEAARRAPGDQAPRERLSAADMVREQRRFTGQVAETAAGFRGGGGGGAMTPAALGAAQATAGEAGEVFLYTFDAPLSLARQRSAMVPVLLSSVEGHRVSIYNPGDMPKHPMRGVRITNDTELHLMPGPLSVYDGDTYSGDAQIPHTSRGQSRLLSYALDIDVHARRESRTDQTVVQLRIVDGSVRRRMKRQRRTEYVFSNHDRARGRTIQVEHARPDGWELVEPGDPFETTDSYYRFRLELDAGANRELAVVEERVVYDEVAVTSIDLETLAAYFRQGKVSKQVRDAIMTAARLQAEINDQQRRIGELDRRRDAIHADQSRIRSNMSRIDRQSDLYRRYMTKLNAQETELEQIFRQREEATEALEASRAELEQFLAGLEVE